MPDQSGPKFDQLENLQANLAAYRNVVDKLTSETLTGPKNWQACFLEILIRLSKLYLDYLLVVRDMPLLEAASSKRGSSDLIRANAGRQKAIREKLRQQLHSSVDWNQRFRPENAFSQSTGLRSLQDYENLLTLHLPEIYEETFRIEVCTESFVRNHDSSALAQLFVGLQHLGCNHVSFVLQAVQWAADEGGLGVNPQALEQAAGGSR